MNAEPDRRCPVCSARTSGHLVVNACPVHKCSQCGHQFAAIALTDHHVHEQYGDDYFSGGGTAGYADYLASRELVTRHGKRYAAIVDSYCPGSLARKDRRMLDIGCAAGFLMEGFGQSGWEVTGVDPNANMVKHASSRGLDAYQAIFETLTQVADGAITRQRYQLVAMVQVIAHLTDLRRVGTTLAETVDEDGLVLIETWDSASLTARLLRSSWHEYSPPNVLHYFCKASLDSLMSEAGFRCIAGGRPEKRISMGHGRSLFQYKYGRSWWGKTLLRLSSVFPDNFSVPYPSEDLFWRLYQKQDEKISTTAATTR